MVGKSVIMSVLLLSLVLAQIQVEAKSCCPSNIARNCYNVCRLGGQIPRPVCATTCGCKIVIRNCPSGYERDILENTGDAFNEYCKLGCTSSVCSAITTLQNSDAGEEIVNGAVEQCTKACSAFCTKGSITALETSA